MRAFLRALALIAAVFSAPARAEEVACLSHVAENAGPFRIIKAALKAEEVSLTFVGHSTFLLESAKGVRIATDYNDYVKPNAIPDIATMNRAHDTHFTHNPDKRITHVLRGWSDSGPRAVHDLTFHDVRVRNVPTNIRSYNGTERYGNSIFVFEIAGLCIAHLGHLHHTLTPEHLKAIGQLDIVMVPVDGSFTMDQDGMMEVLDTLGAKLMIPMHYFGQSTLNRFLEKTGERYEIKRNATNNTVVSRETLPAKPTVLVLPSRHF